MFTTIMQDIIKGKLFARKEIFMIQDSEWCIVKSVVADIILYWRPRAIHAYFTFVTVHLYDLSVTIMNDWIVLNN